MKKQYIQPQSTAVTCESMQAICAGSGDRNTRISVSTGYIPTGETGD
ncbi:MAG: hypothetical protein IKW35_00745 [Paludibacteraceae bacterium]|nr:hypothetical protein [Paludibacteraceae bacterium]